MRGTFLVNAYLDAAYNEAEIAGFVRQIINRGHDVQFHSHEEFRCFRVCAKTDMDCWEKCTNHESIISRNSYENQFEILGEGAENIERCSQSRICLYWR